MIDLNLPKRIEPTKMNLSDRNRTTSYVSWKLLTFLHDTHDFFVVVVYKFAGRRATGMFVFFFLRLQQTSQSSSARQRHRRVQLPLVAESCALTDS